MSKSVGPELIAAEAEAERIAGKETPRRRGAVLRRALIFVVVVALAFILLHLTPLRDVVEDLQHLRAFIDGFGVRGEFAFAVLTALLMALGTPRLLFYGLAGLLFGFWEGLAAALAGSLLGALVMFRAARWGGRSWVRRRFGEHRLFGRIASVRPTVMAVIMIRQLPLSNVFINVGLALSRVSSRTFLLGTFIGYLPQGVVACLVGSGFASGLAWEGMVQLLLACVFVVALGVWALLRRAAQKRANDPLDNTEG